MKASQKKADTSIDVSFTYEEDSIHLGDEQAFTTQSFLDDLGADRRDRILEVICRVLTNSHEVHQVIEEVMLGDKFEYDEEEDLIRFGEFKFFEESCSCNNQGVSSSFKRLVVDALNKDETAKKEARRISEENYNDNH